MCPHPPQSVVLARDVHAAALLVEHRMVGAVMTKLHLESFAAGCQSHDLMTQADAEKRNAALQALAGRFNGVRAGFGVARAVLKGRRPSGFMASTSCTGVRAGTTVSSMPRSTIRRRMLRLTPKS